MGTCAARGLWLPWRQRRSTPGDRPGFLRGEWSARPAYLPGLPIPTASWGYVRKADPGWTTSRRARRCSPSLGSRPLSGRTTQLPVLPLTLNIPRSMKQTLWASLTVGQPSKTESPTPQRMAVETRVCPWGCACACMVCLYACAWVCCVCAHGSAACVRGCECIVVCTCMCVCAACVQVCAWVCGLCQEAAKRTSYYGITGTWNPVTGTL